MGDVWLHGIDFRRTFTDVPLGGGIVDVAVELGEEAVVDELGEDGGESTDGSGYRFGFTNVDGFVFAVGELCSLDEDAAVGEDQNGAPIFESGIGEEPGFEFADADEFGTTSLCDCVAPLLEILAESGRKNDDCGRREGTGVETMTVALGELHGEVVSDERALRNAAAEDEAADELLELGRSHAIRNHVGKLVVRLVGDTNGTLLEIPTDTDEIELLNSFVMAILEREVDGGAVVFDVSNCALGELLVGGGDENAIDPH